MYPPMTHETILPREPATTVNTLVAFPLVVKTSMHRQVTSPLECLAACFALEQPFTDMNACVLPEQALVEEFPTAYLA
jgi:hypothetical protein